MTTLSGTAVVPVQPKWVGKSMTIWGSLFALIAVGFKTLGPVLDLVGVTVPITEVDVEAVKTAGTDAIALAGSVFGTVLVWWGRFRAGRTAQPVTLNPAATDPVSVVVVKSPKGSG